MTRLTPQEAAEAVRRGREYEHSMAIEGIELTTEERRVFDFINRERMGYEEGVQHVLQWCRDDGLIPDPATAQAAE